MSLPTCITSCVEELLFSISSYNPIVENLLRIIGQLTIKTLEGAHTHILPRLLALQLVVIQAVYLQQRSWTAIFTIDFSIFEIFNQQTDRKTQFDSPRV